MLNLSVDPYTEVASMAKKVVNTITVKVFLFYCNCYVVLMKHGLLGPLISSGVSFFGSSWLFLFQYTDLLILFVCVSFCVLAVSLVTLLCGVFIVEFEQISTLWVATHLPDKIFLFKFNNSNTRKKGEICSELTIKTPERRQ